MPADIKRMVDLTWPEFGERLAERVLVLPLGAIEQHGPHLPLDTDTTTAVRFAEALAARIDGIVLPCFQYGYKSQPASGGGRLFPGTTSLGAEAFVACVRDIVADLFRQGARGILILNANFENTMFAVEGADLATERLKAGAAKVVLVNWWDQVSREVLERAFHGAFPGWEAEHAGVIETSLMLHLDPARVATARIESPSQIPTLPTYWVIPERPGMVPTSGVLRTAAGSSAIIGQMLFDDVADALDRLARREFPDLTSSPEHARSPE
jgi:creatinine amidohydrolase